MKHSVGAATCPLAFLLLLGACGSDSEPTGPSWVDGGIHMAEFHDVEIPDTIQASDTLVVRLSASLNQPTGRPELSQLETSWTAASGLELTVWASVDLWVGSGPMPPTDLEVLRNHELRVPPPFPADRFTVRIYQPSGVVETDTVVVDDSM